MFSFKGNLTIRQKLNKLANKFQNCSEVSAQECVYTLLSMPVSKSSRDTMFINTYPLKERNLILKESKWLKLIKDPESTDVFRKSISEHYKNRPDSLVDICLADFVGNYNYVSNLQYSKNKNTNKLNLFGEEDDDIDEDLYDEIFEGEILADKNEIQNDYSNMPLDTDSYIALKNKDGYIKKRQRSRILRYKRYKINVDEWNHFRVQLMLYLPWLIEEDEIEVKDTFEKFEKNKMTILRNRHLFESVVIELYDQEVERIEQEIEEHYYNLNDKQTDDMNKIHNRLLIEDNYNKQNNEDYEEQEQYEDEYGYHSYLIDPITNNPRNKSKLFSITVPKRLSDVKYNELMNGLNELQQVYSKNFLNRFKKNEPIYDFIRGGSGTGKSFLISSIYQSALRYMCPNELENDSDYVMAAIGAYTGKAAFNVKGETLFRLFHLPTHTTNMRPLSGSVLNKLTKQFSKLKLVITDELSLIGCRIKVWIDARLRQLKNPKLPFGGVSIIQVGDFNQLQPLQDKWIFEKCMSCPYEHFVGDDLWDNFKLFELTEIMRQKDDAIFAQALNKLGDDGVIGLSKEQVELFDSRIIVDVASIPHDAILLFHTNKEVAKYNIEKVTSASGDLIINDAIDYPTGQDKDLKCAINMAKNLKNIHNLDETCGLPYSLLLKLNCKYMITSNMIVSDGLTNGAVGILKKIVLSNTKNDTKPKVKRCWFDFVDEDIGRNTRNDSLHYFTKDKVNFSNKWTPLKYQEEEIKKSTGAKYQIVRKQFALIECEAMTIHKSQGQTYKKVGVGLTPSMTRALLYVGMSRATSLNGLYLFGQKSIQSERIRKMKEITKQRAIEKDNANSKVKQEMIRLRKNCKLTNLFPFLTDNNNNNNNNIITLMFQNIRALNSTKCVCIEKDIGFQKTDILMFVETHTNLNYVSLQSRTLKGFETKSISGSYTKNSSNGMICFAKNSKSSNLYEIDINYEKNLLELKIFVYSFTSDSRIYIILLYKHPKMKKSEFFLEFNKFIKKNFRMDNNVIQNNVFILGDFNIDFNKKQKYLQTFMNDFNLRPTNLNDITHDSGSQLDWCFTNCNQTKYSYETITYESWISDHKPIRLQIKQL